jgi:glyoxylase-like metal-dependent hydrolase (beta-lactamase superfamily II)
VVVDPQRDIAQYLADAATEGVVIERVIETHVHADFLSGHLELADQTGAVISYGAGADVGFPIDPRARRAAPIPGPGDPGDPGHARPHPRVDLRGCLGAPG